MTRWAIRFASSGERAGTNASKRWQFVGFAGPNGSESRGIVDLVAIRRDHLTSDKSFRIGDLFEIVFVQIKGGGAPWPTFDDVKRLRAVQRIGDRLARVLHGNSLGDALFIGAPARWLSLLHAGEEAWSAPVRIDGLLHEHLFEERGEHPSFCGAAQEDRENVLGSCCEYASPAVLGQSVGHFRA
jgi:hypothetical protein